MSLDERRSQTLDAILITATAHGWNGVDNSKILEVFIENELDELAELRSEQEKNQERFAWLEWAMTSNMDDNSSLRAWIRLADELAKDKNLVHAIDQLRAERREQ